jgi:hypothetical protein
MALLDSPLELDFQGYSDGSASALSLAERVVKKKEQLLDSNGDFSLISEKCFHSGTEQWKCIFGEVFLKYLQQQAVVIADQYDHRMLTAQLGMSYGQRFDFYTLDES